MSQGRGDADIAQVAGLLAEPARAAMLTALLDGRALAAGELARIAGVTPSTASSHLARLLEAGMVTVLPQGRHRYYRLAGPDVAELLETLARVSPRAPVRSLRQSRRARRLAAARTCYDHLAGRAGVELLAALLDGGHLEAGADDAYAVTPLGEVTLKELGVNLDEARRLRRRFAPACLDWTERRPHLGGGLGAAVTAALIRLGWFEHGTERRALRVTERARDGLDAIRAGTVPPSER